MWVHGCGSQNLDLAAGQRRDAEVQRPDDGRLCGNSSNMMRLD